MHTNAKNVVKGLSTIINYTDITKNVHDQLLILNMIYRHTHIEVTTSSTDPIIIHSTCIICLLALYVYYIFSIVLLCSLIVKDDGLFVYNVYMSHLN